MSERILRALMQLFAIVAKVDEIEDASQEDIENASAKIISSRGREIIESFLKSELSSSDVKKYLTVFDNFLIETRGRLFARSGSAKRTSLQSVKVLRICEQINQELTQRQKFIVLIRIFEFINADHHSSEKESEFVQTVADSFHITNEEYELLRSFTEAEEDEIIDEKNHIYYTGKQEIPLLKAKSGVLEGLEGLIHAIRIESIKTIFFRYFGSDELYINGLVVANDKTHLFNVGATTRTTKSIQLYYSDIISRLTERSEQEKLSFELKNVIHTFRNGKIGLQKFSFSTREAQLIGIMGGSGTGKTTLLNIMNGKVNPTYGEVLINGINLYEDPKQLEGVIGNIGQDDILIEELTVFENLYYSAKLCLSDLSETELKKRVTGMLQSLGLYEIRHLKVGSVLDKVISGGQRKRLNIALELIREPAILFVDEPTSGLSSKDSENIMDLLKELALSGKIVFVVIHQPSSNIFKMFDRLLIMDEGGYPIYDGIPLNAIAHFKTHSYRGNAQERECSLCGNVNPEQLFNIIDARIVDEFGNETAERKRDARDWYELFQKYRPKMNFEAVRGTPKLISRLPGRFSQYVSYFFRDLNSKLSNVQYVIVNLVVAPSLALLLSFFIKYFNISANQEIYSFFGNENIPQYIFIAVIVSIFLGLTAAAEEINKDKKILARESFLNLSRQSYLLSKVSILVILSLVQSGLFTLIGNSILEIEGMFLKFWLILFTTSFASNIMGLIISSAFNSAKVIYIVVPLFIIPQLLFSGVIVKFDKLHPSLSNATTVPWIGNVMASRWSYEALSVELLSQNELESQLLDFKCARSEAQWKKDYWIPQIKNQLAVVTKPDVSSNIRAAALEMLRNEIASEDLHWNNLSCKNCLNILKGSEIKSEADIQPIDEFLNIIRLQSINTINRYNDSLQFRIEEMGSEKYNELKERYVNESLLDIATNRLENKKFIQLNGKIYQNDDAIYHDPKGTSFFNTHFYAPYKYVFKTKMTTYWANLMVLWIMCLIAYVVLYFDMLRKLLEGINTIYQGFKK